MGTITNDDGGTAPTFSIDNVTMAEGNAGTTNFIFTVTKTGVTGIRSRVDFATANGTTDPATGGAACGGSVDYVSQTGTLAFPPTGPGSTSQTITVAVCGETTFEPNETFFVNLSNPVNGSISQAQGLGTITNDDCAAFGTVYVDDSWVGTAFMADPDRRRTGDEFWLRLIRHDSGRRDGVTSGGTVIVRAGNYPENVVVPKSVTLNGPNVGIDPNTGSRVAEAVVRPAVTETSVQSSTSGTVFRVGTGSGHIDVTINGFTIDGNNPSLTNGRVLNGVQVHTGAGIISSTGSFDNETSGYDTTMIVTNNVIQNLERYGVYVSGVNSGAQVLAGNDASHNKIDNLPSGNNFGGDRGRGIAFGWDVYGSATFNVMTRVNVGWQTDNHFQASTGAGTVVSNNEIRAYHRGIFHNLQYGTASTATISDNNIFAETNGDFAASATNFGIEVASIATAVGVTLTNNNSTGNVYGILLWNLSTTGVVSVSGGTLTNNSYGIYATNNDPQFGAVSTSTTASVSGVTITGATTAGIAVVDDPGPGATGTVALEVSGNTSISTSTVGILVTGVNASANVHDNTSSINGNTTAGIRVDTGSATITTNRIRNNGIGLEVTNAATVTATCNNFAFNTTGVYLSASATNGATINNNNITGNGAGIQNDGPATVNAENNYWGRASGPTAAGNPSGTGDSASSNVDFDPFLSSPAPCAPIVTFTITASAGPNGSIVPSGVITVAYGQGQTFNINPSPGYHVADIQINSVSQGPAPSFTFNNVTANFTIHVTFAPDSVSVHDAQAAEPPSGTGQLLFTVTLSAPAPPAGASVNYATAAGGGNPATAGAVCGGSVDYLTTNGTVTFAPGEQIKTVNVPVCADGTSEPDETLLLNLSSPTGTVIGVGQGLGTITQNNNAGTFLISELRTSGPGGAGDDYVEVYNNSDTPLTVAASDASAGYGVFKMGADCNATPVLVGTIPNGTVIPARGHYLLVGSQYSLGSVRCSGSNAHR